MSSFQWKQLFGYLMQTTYIGRIPVYCNGSQMEGSVGCGIWNKHSNILAKLPNNVSISTTELQAIYLGIQFIADRQGIYVIFSDSLSSNCSLQSSEPSKNYLVLKINELLKALTHEKVIIDWIPSHMGIYGSEEAGNLSKKSLKLITITTILLPYKDMHKIIDRYYAKIWQRQTYTNPVMANLSKNRNQFSQVMQQIRDRRNQVVYARLRLGTFVFTYKHHIYGVEKEHCFVSDMPMILDHLIIDCPQYSGE